MPSGKNYLSFRGTANAVGGHFPEPSARRVDVKATVLGSRFDGYLASKQLPEPGCVFRPIFPGGIRLNLSKYNL